MGRIRRAEKGKIRQSHASPPKPLVPRRTISTYLALQEVQTAVLRQDGGWRFASVAGNVVADVFSQYAFNIFLGEAMEEKRRTV